MRKKLLEYGERMATYEGHTLPHVQYDGHI